MRRSGVESQERIGATSSGNDRDVGVSCMSCWSLTDGTRRRSRWVKRRGEKRRGEERRRQSRLGMTLSLSSPRVCYLSLPRPILQITSVLFWRTVCLPSYHVFLHFRILGDAEFEIRSFRNLIPLQENPGDVMQMKRNDIIWCDVA